MKVKNLRRASQEEKAKFADYLADGEEIIVVFGIGKKYFWLNAFSFGFLSLVLIGIPFLLKLIHLKHSKTYILTDRRVLVRDGVLTTKLTSAPYDKITHITVKESFINRLSYGIGDITIHTAGPTPVEIDLVKVDNPMKVKNLMEELIVKERSLLGVTSVKEPLIRRFS